jgi:hypothetical protein
MELNKKAEVAIHGKTAGFEFAVEPSPSGYEMRVYSEEANVEKSFELNQNQLAATLALFINAGEFEDKVLTTKLYWIAEQVWKNTGDFRLIP